MQWPPTSVGPRIWNSEAAASIKKDARAEITGMVSLRCMYTHINDGFEKL